MEIHSRSAHFDPATHSLHGTKGAEKQPPEVKVKIPADQTSPALYARGVTAKMTAKGTQANSDTEPVGKWFGGDASKFSGFISSIKDAEY